jgi:AcrR family transcriptional regulator
VPARRDKGEDKGMGDLGPLPGGHHGLSREQVAESQRERLIAGIAHVVAQRGYRGTTITEIVKASSVSSRAFYENFESKEDCFLAAFDAVVAHLRELLGEAAGGEADWPHRTIAALRAALDFFAAEPDLARLCLVEPVTASPRIATHFREIVVSAIPFLQPGRDERPGAEPLPESTEDSLLGGLIVLVSRSIVVDDPGALEGILPDLVDFVLSPYLGAERAKELAREAASKPL